MCLCLKEREKVVCNTVNKCAHMFRNNKHKERETKREKHTPRAARTHTHTQHTQKSALYTYKYNNTYT